MARTVKCGLIQAKNAGPTDGSIEEIKRLNIEKHVAMINDAAKQGVQILCMQEVFTTPYFCAEQQIRLVQRLQHEPTAHYFTLAWFGSDGRACFLNPDFCSHFYHLGRFFLGADELLAGRRAAVDENGRDKGFYVAAPATDFLYYLIKKMDKQDLSVRSGAWLSRRWRQVNCRRRGPLPTLRGC